MNSTARSVVRWLLSVSSAWTVVLANISLPVSLEDRIDSAGAICRGRVISQEVFQHPESNRVFTRTAISVDEPLKGKFPPVLFVLYRGGILHGRGVFDSAAPLLRTGDERVFFLGVTSDGTLYYQGGSAATPLIHPNSQGMRKSPDGGLTEEARRLLARIRSRIPNPSGSGLDLTLLKMPVPDNEVALRQVSGLYTDPSGASRRFTTGDRGEPIEYLVDADALPAGISRTQALDAVSAAFTAWSEVTSLKFVFAGIVSLGRAAADSEIQDGRIRIQLHDLYESIHDPEQLGIGGTEIRIASQFPNGGMGGKVGDVEFFPVTQGYVSIRHTHAAFASLETLEEVLCHEIGHVLSMAHSSENQDETDSLLRDAIMFRYAHRDGRGARLGAYDPPIVQHAYPRINTPSYGYDRVLRAVTTPGPEPTIPGINQVEFRAYDLQTDNLEITLLTGLTSGSGDFTVAGSVVKFTPSGFFNAPPLDPSDSWYELAYVRVSDGTNASPYYAINVISMQPDQNPKEAPDGLPDSWVAEFFGNASASVDPNGDADSDGITNADEFRIGTNPVDPSDVLQFSSMTQKSLAWTANPYDLYEVQATTDLRNWYQFGNLVRPTSSFGSITIPERAGEDPVFFRLWRVP